MAATTWEALKNKQSELIRKALEGSVFVAPISATAITTLTTTASALNALPAGYEDLGQISKDGLSWGRSVDISDVTSWGETEPTRSDVTKDVTTLKCVAQETKLLTIGLHTGADTSGVIATVGTGEVAIAKPSISASKFYRVLAISVDIGDGGEIYIARYLPRAKIVDYAEQKWSDGDDPIQYDLTWQSFVDSTLGYSEKYFWGGPGWLALLDEMGITLGT